MSGNHQSVPEEITLDSIEEAIAAIKAGEIIIVVDDEDRENEGDFICAAECINPEMINFMATHGRGLICTPIEDKRADELELNMMVSNNTALHETAFTVSIDLIGQGCTTGISAYDRSSGIKAMIDPNIKASDFARPGHIFPLRAKSGGVLRRTGHTEAAIDLARLAGYYPAGVLVEILNEDGTMARLPNLIKIAEKHQLKIISIEDLVAYRLRTERLITKGEAFNMQTKHGDFKIIPYTQITSGDVHLAIVKGDLTKEDAPLVRVHSSTETGDILGILFEDYGRKLEQAISMIGKEENGLFLYMRHSEKDKALLGKYLGKTTNDDGPDAEQKGYGVGAQIIKDLGLSNIKLITNSPKKRIGLDGYGINIVDYIKLETS